MALITDDSPDQGKKKQSKKRDQYREDFDWLMSTERGRRLMWSWLGECGIFQTSVRGGTDGNAVYFNEGMRNIGLMRMGDINSICPNNYVKMLKEAGDGS
jgi:hypothetical protein